MAGKAEGIIAGMTLGVLAKALACTKRGPLAFMRLAEKAAGTPGFRSFAFMMGHDRRPLKEGERSRCGLIRLPFRVWNMR